MPALVPTQDYGAVLNELARAIRRRRSECLPWETARALLRYDTPDHTHLVGIDNEATHAVLYHCEGGYAIAVPITPDGIEDGGNEIANFAHGPPIEKWVSKRYPDFGWIHPRYR